MSFSIPQAASLLGVLWLDAPAAFTPEDSSHLLGLYRYDFTGAAPEPEPEAPAVEHRARGGSAVGVKLRRKISDAVEGSWRKLYGPRDVLPQAVVESVTEAVAEKVAPGASVDEATLGLIITLLDVIGSRMLADRAERDAEETALLIALDVV